MKIGTDPNSHQQDKIRENYFVTSENRLENTKKLTKKKSNNKM
jgi:hypothetical protein